jgi:hypothetical protein
MTPKWVLLKTIQSEPGNQLACYAMADLLEEQGWLDLAFCYRWMGWYNRRPGRREGERLRKRFVWYKEGAALDYTSEKVHYDRLTNAWLPPLVHQSLEPTYPHYQLYTTWEQAVNNLARALAFIRALLQPPAGV